MHVGHACSGSVLGFVLAKRWRYHHDASTGLTRLLELYGHKMPTLEFTSTMKQALVGREGTGGGKGGSGQQASNLCYRQVEDVCQVPPSKCHVAPRIESRPSFVDATLVAVNGAVLLEMSTVCRSPSYRFADVIRFCCSLILQSRQLDLQRVAKRPCSCMRTV